MPGDTRNIRSPAQRDRDRAQIASQLRRGIRHAEIAASLGVTRQEVGWELQRMRAKWAAQVKLDTEVLVRQEVEKLNEVESEAWQAWERSKQPRDVTTTRQRRRGLGGLKRDGDVPLDNVSEAVKRSEAQVGDPSYLDIIARCVDQRSRLLGLSAPSQIRHTGGVVVTEIVYEPAQDQTDARLTIIGGPHQQPAALNAQALDIESIAAPTWDDDEPEPVA